jgi:hypothetical protein
LLTKNAKALKVVFAILIGLVANSQLGTKLAEQAKLIGFASNVLENYNKRYEKFAKSQEAAFDLSSQTKGITSLINGLNDLEPN